MVAFDDVSSLNWRDLAFCIDSPFGQVGGEVSLEQEKASARQVGLTILSNVKRGLGYLGRIRQWIKGLGMVNSAPGFKDHSKVINGFTNLIIDIFSLETFKHTRSVFGMSSLPFNVGVEIEAQLLIFYDRFRRPRSRTARSRHENFAPELRSKFLNRIGSLLHPRLPDIGFGRLVHRRMWKYPLYSRHQDLFYLCI